jgi:Type II secretion system protein B
LSSILRALKKLENEPKHLEKTQTLDSKFVPLADTWPPKKSAGRLFLIIGGAIVFGLVIVAGGWWLLSEKKLQAPTPPQEIARQKPEAASVIQEKSAIPPKPTEGHGAAGPAANRRPEPTPIVLPQPSSPIIEQKEGLSIVAQPVESSGLSSVTQAAEDAGPVAVENEPALENSPVQTPLEQVEKVELPVLKDTGIKLQAITWSKDPQKRIAVINNSILRQGETVSGYRIEVINQDDIILNDRGKKWKLLFRIR